MKRARFGFATTLGILALVGVALTVPAWAAKTTSTALTCPYMSGSVYTTNSSGAIVNQNLYDKKEDVYLRISGPNGKQLSSDWNGTYAFRVTNPNGDKVLAEGNFLVASGGIVSVSSVGLVERNFVKGSTFFQLIPYLNTDNPAGEYKVWVASWQNQSDSPLFAAACSKTDNFKVNTHDQGGNDQEVTYITVKISGLVFRDFGDPGQSGVLPNGRFDLKEGDTPEPDVHVYLFGNSLSPIPSPYTTSADGTYTFLVTVPVGSVLSVAPMLTQGTDLVFGPMTPPVRHAVIAANTKNVSLDFGLVRISDYPGVYIGHSGANIEFTPEYFSDSSSGPGFDIMKWYLANTLQIPTFLQSPGQSPVLSNSACPPPVSLNTPDSIKGYLNDASYNSNLSCKLTAAWLTVNLSIAMNGITTDIGLPDPLDAGKVSYTVRSISGGETIRLYPRIDYTQNPACDFGANDQIVCSSTYEFASLQDFLNIVAADCADPTASTCNIAKYLPVLQGAASNKNYLYGVYIGDNGQF